MAESSALARDLDALQRVGPRFAGSDEERRMVDAVLARLPDGVRGRVEGFVCHPSPLFVLGVHGILVFLAGLVGYRHPGLGALACLVITVSLVGEGSGRLPTLRWWLGKVPSYNLVVPPEAGQAAGTIVLTTPLDVPRARMWRPRWLRRPVAAVLVSSVLLTGLLVLRSLAEPWGRPLMVLYGISMAVMAVTGALAWVSRREPRHVTADPSGLAVALEVLRRVRAEPVPGVAVWVVFTGAGRAHQEGMDAFLSLRGTRMQEPVLVISLHDAARPPFCAVETEGPLWPQHHRPTGPALVERLRWSGVRIPVVDRPEASDARMAMILGYRALCLAGGEGEPTVEAADRAADVVESVLRFFGDDVGHMASRRPWLLEELGEVP